MTAVVIYHALSGIQNCVSAFMAIFLVRQVGLDIVTSGALIATVQGAAIAGRIGWGLCSDYLATPRTILVLLGFGTGCALIVVSLLSAGTAMPIIALAMIFLGSTAAGWNGVFLSEVAQAAPTGTVSFATGGIVVFAYLGFILAPLAFAIVSEMQGIAGGFRYCGCLSILATIPSFVARVRTPAAI